MERLVFFPLSSRARRRTINLIHTTIMQTTLYFREGGSDKVYQVEIRGCGNSTYQVYASWGRRGSTLQTALKSPHPTILVEANRLYTRLVASKVAKGYFGGEAGTLYHGTELQGLDTGVRCQLLNPVPEEEVEELLSDSRYVLQEKFDGVRMLIRKTGKEVMGINRRGLLIPLPEPILHAAQAHPFDFLLDGEGVGDVFHAFDLLELESRDCRERPYLDRYLDLLRYFESSKSLKLALTADTCEQRKKLFHSLREAGAEGVVLKDRFAPHNPGRPASGGSQLKFKFVNTATFIVSSINKRRSVGIALLDGKEQRPAGNVTIPAKLEIPEVGELIEVRYLYAFAESGSIYQPVFLRKRDDVDHADCSVDQLHFKASVRVA